MTDAQGRQQMENRGVPSGDVEPPQRRVKTMDSRTGLARRSRSRKAGGARVPGDELLGRLRAQLHLRHFLRGQVRRLLDEEVRSMNWLTGITLLLIFPRLQGAFKGLFKINTAMNCALRAKHTQINVYLR